MSLNDYSAERVEILDEDTYRTRPSKREYLKISQVRGIQTRGDYYRFAEAVDLTLYLDPQTGLVVYDVAAYEKNLPREECRES